MKLLSLVVFLAILGIGCEREVNIVNELPEPTAPTPVAKDDIIEFRVTGTYPSVTIRVNNSMDGLQQVTTGLPYSATIQSRLDLVFVSLEVSVPFGASIPLNPFLQAQIFINGSIFREANTTSSSPVLNISGTYRRRTTVQAVIGNNSK